ncbi:MAG: VWA domain-containing protein [Bacteroidota bacterium]
MKYLIYLVASCLLLSGNVPKSLHVVGEVRSEEGEMLSAALVEVMPIERTVRTDSQGKFELTIPMDTARLIIRKGGYFADTVAVFSDTVLNIVLQQKPGELDEVVIVGYGSVKRSEMTGSVSTVTTRSEPKMAAPAMSVEAEAFRGEAMMDYETRAGFGSDADLPKSGQLTAGEIHDFSKWTLWEDLTKGELKAHRKTWQLFPEQRFALQIIDQQSQPVVDHTVSLWHRGKEKIWEAKTDNTGKAELWAGMFDGDELSDLTIQVERQGQVVAEMPGLPFFQDINTLQIKLPCDQPQTIDIAFVVDATGSMADEISYLQAELTDVIQRIEDSLPEQPLRLGSVFYRDQNDEYLYRYQALTEDRAATKAFIQAQQANGGGDFPEAADIALEVAIDSLDWSDRAAGRLLFLLLDAPPHTEGENMLRIKRLTQKAAQRGIRIIPLTGSGIDKSTEYLMRSLALATNGTYTFLTNHSGIGGDHIEPSTDSYEVELANDLLTRLVLQFGRVNPCGENTFSSLDPDTVWIPSPTVEVDSPQVASEDAMPATRPLPAWRFFPNPTDGWVRVSCEESILEAYVIDLSGKILRRKVFDAEQQFGLDLSPFPVGIYQLRLKLAEDRWLTDKVIRR